MPGAPDLRPPDKTWRLRPGLHPILTTLCLHTLTHAALPLFCRVQGNRTKIPLTAYKRLGEITPAGFEVEMTRTMGGPAGNGAATSDKDASPTTTVGVMKFIAPSLVV